MVQPAEAEIEFEDVGDDGARVFTVGIQKAAGMGSDAIQDGQTRDMDEATWGGNPIVPTPLPTVGLVHWYERSSILRPNIAAMVQHVTGFGWKLVPQIDLEGEFAAEDVATAMWLHRLAEWEQELESFEGDDEDKPAPPEPPEADEVGETLKEWRMVARREYAQLQVKLDALCFEVDFQELNARQESGQNVVGWGAWEVIRSPKTRRILRLKHVEPWTLRLTPLGDPVEVEESVAVSKVHYVQQMVTRRFRRVIQQDVHVVYLKEFGDPRVMSPETGTYYKDADALSRQEQGVSPANEILWFSEYAIGTPYGRPPWHGISPGVRGARLASDNTVDDLLNQSVPRGMLLAVDSRFGKDVTGEIKNFFSAHHGKMRNRLMVIEATTSKTVSQGGATANIEYIPLTKSQQNEGTFLQYQEFTALEAGAQFGIPPVIVGRSKDYNRSTSEAAREAAEEGTFRPRRNRFDGVINRKLLRDMGIRFWRFESKGPTRSDPEKIGKILAVALKEGAITPVEARPVLEKLLGIDLVSESGPWQRQPMAMTLAGYEPPDDTTSAEATDGGNEDETEEDDDREKSLARVGKLLRLEGDEILRRLPASTRTRGEQMLNAMEDGLGEDED